MTTILVLLDYLSDGEFHSGEDIAATLKVSRTAIWKQMKKLNEILPDKVLSIPGKGYKLSEPMAVLDKDKIRSFISQQSQAMLDEIDVILECESTNQLLLDKAEQHHSGNYLLLAESQTQGRGRRGRQWVSPFAGNIYMSLSWGLGISIAQMSGLSLVVAISTAKGLKKSGIEHVKLKWPNDIYVAQQKLAGVLLELRGETNSPGRAVMGIGINANMPVEAGEQIDQPWIDIRRIVGHSVDRNRVAANILNELIPDIMKFETNGFTAFMSEWEKFDLLEGQPVNVIGQSQLETGIARGVDAQGALLVEFDNTVQPIYSGEVSIRVNI